MFGGIYADGLLVDSTSFQVPVAVLPHRRFSAAHTALSTKQTVQGLCLIGCQGNFVSVFLSVRQSKPTVPYCLSQIPRIRVR